MNLPRWLGTSLKRTVVAPVFSLMSAINLSIATPADSGVSGLEEEQRRGCGFILGQYHRINPFLTLDEVTTEGSKASP